MDRFDENRVLAIAYGIASIVILVISQTTQYFALVVTGVIAAGFFVVGGQVGLNALASGYYPNSSRGTGVSWANGVGRTGSIIGSLIGGSSITLGWGAGNIFLLLALPAFIAALAMLAMGYAHHSHK
jgi:MFS transporter, AAHS family, 4-hydroxybenzoate transporter